MKLKEILAIFLCISLCKSEPQRLSDLTRIIGGYETTAREIGGFLVAMRDSGDFICGGSLIAPQVVVSAAHCISGRMRRIGSLTIEGGVTLLNEETTRVRVERAFIPKSYNEIANNMDVAVLKLQKPLEGGDIQTIKLCSHTLKKGDMITVSGWGLGSLTEYFPRLHVQSVVVPVISKSKCSKIYSAITDITDSMLCAGVLESKDACQYDSGGPLVYNNELCGIVSFGVTCADSYPGVYTDVKFVTPWIEKAISKLEKSTPEN